MKRVFIVPHSHWDREWYMPFEQHHMRLVELLDHVLWLFKNDPDYKFFHLDGQTVALDDYLQVRPEKKQEIQAAIDAGQLQIGPFYILQDDFLTSNESNVRNMLVGREATKKWGGKFVHVGYFPDTFGNMGQTPQLMKQADMDVAMFGRGVKPTGFANAVSEDTDFNSSYSEMNWVGPDGTNILGVLFANWYNNGAEIPTDPALAKPWWDKKMAAAAKVASTDDLLFLNGSDHEPVQLDLSEAIRVANSLYPDVEFIHSNYNDYLKQLKQDLPDDLDTIHGEITSQETSGWTTLANTASNRVGVKQANTEVARQLENIAEPLATMDHELLGNAYPQDQLNYAWEWFMQNHPHDSICSCSVDEVIDEIMTRFLKANEVGKYVAHEALDHLTAKINTKAVAKDGEVPFVLFNTGTSAKTDAVKVDVLIDKHVFNPNRDNPQQIMADLKNQALPQYQVVDSANEPIAAAILGVDVRFSYVLPKDRFREPFIGRYLQVEVLCKDMPGLSWQTLKLVPAAEKTPATATLVHDETLENEYLKVSVASDGSLTILDKETDHEYRHAMVFEDTGDLGNEYVFRASADEPIYSTQFPHHVAVTENAAVAGELTLTTEMQLPASMDDTFLAEQKVHVDVVKRQAKRSHKLVPFTLTTTIRLVKGGKRLAIQTKFNNQAKDHRLRVLFPTDMTATHNYADSIFEVVKRPNKVSAKWENPENPQHTHAFVSVHNEVRGITVSNFGLNEYETTQTGDQIAVPIVRCIGEMGDWGYFPTPGAQMQGEQTMSFGVSYYDGSEAGMLSTIHDAWAAQVPLQTATLAIQDGPLAADYQFLALPPSTAKVTAVKRADDGAGVVVRQYNLTPHDISVDLSLPGYQAQTINVIEEVQEAEGNKLSLGGAEIHTSLFTKEDEAK